MIRVFVVLGVVVLMAGGFLTFYTVVETESVFGVTLITEVESPFQGWGLALLFLGVLSLVMGLILPGKSTSYDA